MNFEPAATDASQTRHLQSGVEVEAGSLSRLVPFAAVVEVTSWTASDFEMDINQKHWARREKQLDQAISHTAMLYGSVQGIVGQNALPDIESLQIGDGNL